jgi:hypothetical protein
MQVCITRKGAHKLFQGLELAIRLQQQALLILPLTQSNDSTIFLTCSEMGFGD